MYFITRVNELDDANSGRRYAGFLRRFVPSSVCRHCVCQRLQVELCGAASACCRFPVRRRVGQQHPADDGWSSSVASPQSSSSSAAAFFACRWWRRSAAARSPVITEPPWRRRPVTGRCRRQWLNAGRYPYAALQIHRLETTPCRAAYR